MDYRSDQKVEEGDYKDNLKEGKWLKYYNNDRVKHELTYQNDLPSGQNQLSLSYAEPALPGRRTEILDEPYNPPIRSRSKSRRIY